jgi:Glu-tRNA(Gln) amidotransferase subunit E-like FAD-binding protein
LEKRKEKPTVKQIEYLQRILANMSDEDVSEILNNKSVDQLSGDDVKQILDEISEENKTNIAPSEKQVALIIRVSDRLSLNLSEILGEMGLNDLSELTGGKDGSASELIDMLLTMDRDSPATERQVSAILSMTEKLEMPIEQALESVRTESIETITKSDASTLIGNLKKTINSKRRGKK